MSEKQHYLTEATIRKVARTVKEYGGNVRYTGPAQQARTLKPVTDGFFAKITFGGTNPLTGHYCYSWTALDPKSGLWAVNADLGQGTYNAASGFAIEVGGSTQVTINSTQFLRPTPGQYFYTFALSGGGGANYAVVHTTGLTTAGGGSTPGTGTGTLQQLVGGTFQDAPGPVTVGFYNVWDRAIISGAYLVVNQAMDANWYATACACSSAT